MTTSTRMACVAAGAIAAAAGLARAQCIGQLIYAGDPQPNLFNGEAVAMDGTYILTGAPGRILSNQASAGEVYAFAPFGNNIYGQVAHITAPVPAAGDEFGSALGLGGGAQWAVIGSKGRASHEGIAYMFRRDLQTNLWGLVDTLDPDLGSGSNFGQSAAMNTPGTIAVVGAPTATVTDIFGTTMGAGQALVYYRSGPNSWTYSADLYQTDPALRHTNDNYGFAVGCEGSTIVVGVPNGDSPTHLSCGYINIWQPNAANQWVADGQVFAPDETAGAYFGQSVAVSGNTIAVGAPYASYQGMAAAGAVYIYRWVNGAWVYNSTIHATDAAAGDQFGTEVSALGVEVVVGTSPLVQKAYVFRRIPATGEYFQDARYKSPGPGQHFASDVAVSVSGLVVGASSYDAPPNLTGFGGAYVYSLPTVGSDSCIGATPVSQGTTTGCTNNCTVDGESNCGAQSPLGPDIWFKYTAAATGPVVIDTQGSGFDTILSVHSGCPGNMSNLIVCNDDVLPQRWSRLTLNVIQGQSYQIRVAGYGQEMGEFTLNIGPVGGGCYANCDVSTAAPVLNVNDFVCFLNKFGAADPYANCDGSTTAPVLNVNDFTCFVNRYAVGCP